MSDPVAAHWLDPAALTSPHRHLFLSPHYDDVALSCGGTALLLAQADRRPEVALLFGAAPDPAQPLTPFALGQHEGWGLSAAEVIAARRAEEAAAAAILGARVAYLPFRDAIYRGEWYTSNELLFADPVAGEAGLPGEIVASLGLAEVPDGATRIYAPLAIGLHVDHQHAAAAGIALARAGWDVLFYEDLPYAIRAGITEARCNRLEEPMVEAGRIPIGDVWDAKIAAILCYPSQLATVFSYVDAGASRGEIELVMRRYALTIGGVEPAERFWRLRSAARDWTTGMARQCGRNLPGCGRTKVSEIRRREGIDRPAPPC